MSEVICRQIWKYPSEDSPPNSWPLWRGFIGGELLRFMQSINYVLLNIFRLTGYVVMKVGKTVATELEGSCILMQIAFYKGCINVDWLKSTNKDLEGCVEKVGRERLWPLISSIVE